MQLCEELSNTQGMPPYLPLEVCAFLQEDLKDVHRFLDWIESPSMQLAFPFSQENSKN